MGSCALGALDFAQPRGRQLIQDRAVRPVPYRRAAPKSVLTIFFLPFLGDFGDPLAGWNACLPFSVR